MRAVPARPAGRRSASHAMTPATARRPGAANASSRARLAGRLGARRRAAYRGSVASRRRRRSTPVRRPRGPARVDAHAVHAPGEARLHQPSRGGVGAADQLVVEVDRGARRLREHLERAGGCRARGHGTGRARRGVARARYSAARRGRRGRGAAAGRRAATGVGGAARSRRGRGGSGGRRGARRAVALRPRAAEPVGRAARPRLEAGAERLALVGGLARAPGRRALERLARRVELAERRDGPRPGAGRGSSAARRWCRR